MTYDEFVSKSPEYYMDMVRLIDIKIKHRMEMTEDEKRINEFIMEVQENNKINALRNRFEKLWDIDQ
jgi:hypothetical protein|tara:strand:- start:38 stop:238 length:201 start_codon:yes stop_codon:yes gene_type:complete